MFTVTSYPHGTFCWADLSTHGGNAAVDFYSQLMGWQTETQDSGFGTSYTMFRQDGHAIAGLAWLTREMSEIPSSWNNYVSVDDVDALMPTVTEGGGQIIQPPFDVPDGARIALILDPAGAALCLFQQRGNIGAGLINTPGALCWNQLYTREPEAVRVFYSALLGWDFQEDETGSFMILNQGRANGNMITISEDMGDMPSMWLPYFSVADIEAAAERVKALGGAVHMGPLDVGGDIGRFLLFTDPQGAHCFLIQLNAPEPWVG